MSKSLLILFSFIVVNAAAQHQAAIFFQESNQTKFAIEKVRKSLAGKGYRVTINPASFDKEHNTIIFCTWNDAAWVKSKTNNNIPTAEGLEAEGFSIQRVKENNATTIFVVGYDMPGLMYGGLELAEHLRFNELTSITAITQNPYMKR